MIISEGSVVKIELSVGSQMVVDLQITLESCLHADSTAGGSRVYLRVYISIFLTSFQGMHNTDTADL